MKKIACIVKGYPRLSETFIAQELLALEQSGVDIVIYSLRLPTDKSTHPIHEKIKAPVYYLPEYLYQQPLRVLKSLLKALLAGHFYQVLVLFLKDLVRDPSANRIRRFGQALVLAAEIEPNRQWLYAHFLHTPASVARYASYLKDLPWSCSAHAKDIWTTPQWELKEKLAEIQWLVTCTAANTVYLKSLTQQTDKILLVYHGLDLSRFPLPNSRSLADGHDENQPVILISVGRAVSKKGYDILLEALALLPKELLWRFIHIGGGPLLSDLTQQAQRLGINQRIDWLGAQPFERVLEQYQRSDIFVLASRIDKNGDRDGLPNVLMEAMTQELPCISTNISGIPELIENRENGLLVDPEDPQALASEIESLIIDTYSRQQLGLRGRLTIQEKFSMQSNIQTLVDKFNL